MKKLRVLIVLLTLLFSINYSQAQEYRSCLGLKGGFGLNGGFGIGLDFKMLTDVDQAFEGIFTMNAHFLNLTGMYMYNKRIGVSNFFWYVGGGIDGGTYFSEMTRNNLKYQKWDYSFGIGPMGGFEYVFADFPMNICIDFKPSFRIDKHLIQSKIPTFWYEAYLGVRFNLSRY